MSVFTLIRSILSLKSGDQNFFFLLEKRFFYLLMGSGWVAHRVFAIRLVQRLGWVFETQERKKERKLSQVCDLDLSGAGLFPPGFLLLPWQVSPTMEVRSKAENPVVLRPERLLWAGRGRLLAIICLHCLPRVVIFGKLVLNDLTVLHDCTELQISSNEWNVQMVPWRRMGWI